MEQTQLSLRWVRDQCKRADEQHPCPRCLHVLSTVSAGCALATLPSHSRLPHDEERPPVSPPCLSNTSVEPFWIASSFLNHARLLHGDVSTEMDPSAAIRRWRRDTLRRPSDASIFSQEREGGCRPRPCEKEREKKLSRPPRGDEGRRKGTRRREIGD